MRVVKLDATRFVFKAKQNIWENKLSENCLISIDALE
jgi:hypothetical protein